MEVNSKKFTTIFFQDTDVVWSEEDYEEWKPPLYILPSALPRMPNKFDIYYFLEIAEHYIGCKIMNWDLNGLVIKR